MNVLSIFAGVCVFFSISLVGLWLKRKLTRKAEFYEEYYSYLVFVSEKISYERMPIPEIKNSFVKGKTSEFSRFLCGETIAPTLSDEDLGTILIYLDGIGKTDADTQMASLNGKIAEVKRFTEKECVKYKKDGALYFKLGVLLGIIAFIILI